MAKRSCCVSTKGIEVTVKFEGTEVQLDWDDAPELDVGIDDIGVGDVIKKITLDQLIEAASSVAKVGQGLVEREWEEGPKPATVSIEFGLDVAASGSLYVVKGDVKAHVKIKVGW